jgi:GDP-L-fucose synthase
VKSSEKAAMTEERKIPLFDLGEKSVYIAGHTGMVGSALVRRLKSERCRILTVDRAVVDLTSQTETELWISEAKPDAVILAAAKVGGIAYNNAYPVDFLFDNLAIALNVIRASYRAGVKKLLFLGSSCIYPRSAPQPMSEEMLLTGPLEPTNQWYAVAKITGIKLVEAYRRQYGADFISVMPTNLYGPGDNYHPELSHVPAALISRMHQAKISGAPTVTVWGSGKPRREFLAVDDLADACIFVLKHYSGSKFLNVGTGKDNTIAEFAQLVADVVGYHGRFVFDASRPDGVPQKLLDVSELNRLGWRAKIPLREGIAGAYADFLATAGDAKWAHLEQIVRP